jgi:putative acetyltransferase
MFLEPFTADDSVHIRVEDLARKKERAAIRAIHNAAFGGPDEGDIVDKLHADGQTLVSLVAEHGDYILGHILFSRMWIKTETELVPAVALAPVSVLPAHQRQGIGARLISRGLELLRERGERIVIVVGHPDYYPRFGFSSERASSLQSPFPAEAFMAMELSSGALDGIQGAVVYPAAFGF